MVIQPGTDYRTAYVNADFGDISQQSAREHSVLAAGTGLQLIDERQIGWPVPQAQDYSSKSRFADRWINS